MTLATLDNNELAFIHARLEREIRTRAEAARVINATAEYFHVTVDEMTKPGRVTRAMLTPFQMSVYMLRELTGLTLGDIARVMNRGDHTSVMYHDLAVRRRVDHVPMLRRWVSEIESLASRPQH